MERLKREVKKRKEQEINLQSEMDDLREETCKEQHTHMYQLHWGEGFRFPPCPSVCHTKGLPLSIFFAILKDLQYKIALWLSILVQGSQV